jgi:glycosyltransferase involved in cell wall biosynthesis
MIFYALALVALTLLPAALFFRNRSLFRLACSEGQTLDTAAQHKVSVLIPARNEEASIGQAIESILRSNHPCFELLVLDDHSEDRTSEIVQSIASRDQRVSLLSSASLPEGWNGKQHGCWQLAKAAKYDLFLFLDADVRLSSDAITRCVAELLRCDAPLTSGFPFQETKTFAEKLLIPLMHYVLLCYLPIDRMRKDLGAGLAAGCGQLFLARRDEYFRAGGHEAIRGSRHDGIKLPRAFRNAGFKTDIFDARDIATVRMYSSAGQVVRGLLKNATEGIANPRLIVPFTLLLLFGSVLPIPSLISNVGTGSGYWTILFVIAACLSVLPRLLAAKQFHQSWLGAILHPIGVLIFVVLQWTALIRSMLGLSTTWRGRN